MRGNGGRRVAGAPLTLPLRGCPSPAEGRGTSNLPLSPWRETGRPKAGGEGPARAAALTMSAALVWSSIAFAHPSGLPQLRDRAGLALNQAGTWLVWDFHPSILIGICLAIALYALATTLWREKLGGPGTPAPSAGRHLLFLATMTLQYFTLDGPLHHLADDLLFSAHMAQHLILQLVWAPLLVISLPVWLWRALVQPVQPLERWATRPMVAFLLFNAVVYGWHLPAMYNLALTTHKFHILQHVLFMSTAVLSWFVVLAPLPELRASFPKRAAYILLSMVAMKVLGIVISLSDHVLYTFYLGQPRAWGMDALSDQELGGLLMWLPGGIVLWVGLGRLFWMWVRSGTPANGMTGVASIDAARAHLRRPRESGGPG